MLGCREDLAGGCAVVLDEAEGLLTPSSWALLHLRVRARIWARLPPLHLVRIRRGADVGQWDHCKMHPCKGLPRNALRERPGVKPLE